MNKYDESSGDGRKRSVSLTQSANRSGPKAAAQPLVLKKDSKASPDPALRSPSFKADPSRARVNSRQAPPKQIPMSGEYLRKTLHIFSLSIPITYYYVDQRVTLWLLIPITIVSLIIDIGRHYNENLRNIVHKVFDKILREHERDSSKKLLSGATYVLISAVICVLLFPKLITVVAFSILIVSDASSALLGRKYGRHPFLDKSLEGAIAFVLSAWIVVAVAPKPASMLAVYVIGMIASVVGALFEAGSVRLKMDDNLSVPTSISFTMWLLYFALLHFDPATYRPVYDALFMR